MTLPNYHFGQKCLQGLTTYVMFVEWKMYDLVVLPFFNHVFIQTNC